MISPQRPPTGGRRGTQAGTDGPQDKMGNQIWSLESITDFPPLHIDIHEYQEDMRGSEDNSINISSEDQDSSFQEALIREKVEERREIKNGLTVLCRTTPPQEGYYR